MNPPKKTSDSDFQIPCVVNSDPDSEDYYGCGFGF